MSSPPLPPWLRLTPDGVTIQVQVQPNARRSEVVGLYGEQLKVKVASPPVEGAANEALLAFVAAALGVRPREVTLVRGATSRTKVLSIKGVTAEKAASALSPVPTD